MKWQAVKGCFSGSRSTAVDFSIECSLTVPCWRIQSMWCPARLKKVMYENVNLLVVRPCFNGGRRLG